MWITFHFLYKPQSQPYQPLNYQYQPLILMYYCNCQKKNKKNPILVAINYNSYYVDNILYFLNYD